MQVSRCIGRCIGVYRGHVSALSPVYLVAYPFSVLAAEIPRPLCGGVCSREPFEIEREGVSRGLREFGGVPERVRSLRGPLPRGGWLHTRCGCVRSISSRRCRAGLCGAERRAIGVAREDQRFSGERFGKCSLGEPVVVEGELERDRLVDR